MGHNLLQMMYEDPCRWSLTFQTYVQLTMVQNHTKVSNKSVKLMERSLYSAKYCFVENLKKSGKMPLSEYEVLSSWFEFLLSCPQVELGVDLIVYMRTDPEVALSRVKSRSRGSQMKGFRPPPQSEIGQVADFSKYSLDDLPNPGDEW